MKVLWLSLITLILLSTIFVARSCNADEIDDLVEAISWAESCSVDLYFNRKSGARGRMQITPIVLQEYNSINNTHFVNEDLYQKDVNILVGTFYLKRLKNHYLKDHYTLECLLSAWNGGITRLRKVNYDCSKMPKETRNFVCKVLKLYKED